LSLFVKNKISYFKSNLYFSLNIILFDFKYTYKQSVKRDSETR